MSIVVVVAPHPDDETLGCGGTLLRHYANGDDVYWLIMTTMSEKHGFSKEAMLARTKEIDSVSKEYNFSGVYQAKFITSTLDVVPKSKLISVVSYFFNKVKPDIVYVPYRDDIHSDHAAVFDSVASCTKSFRYPFIRSVRAYETLSETEFSIRTDGCGFNPNLWIDISLYMDKKIDIMRLYSGEMKAHPFPRSERNIKSLATLRGATINTDYAESFVAIKEIIL
jgi:LmbE family N-acetylglucosaminyl deacetylase